MKNWRKYNGAIIPNTPPHIDVNIDGIQKLVEEEDVYFARWTTNFDCINKTEFWYIICDSKLEMSDYSRNTRNQIRKGLKHCEVKLINKDFLVEKGYNCYISAFAKYNTYLSPKSLLEFQEELHCFGDSWEFWGIFYEGNLIGYSQNKVIDNYCEYDTIHFHPSYFKFYPSYALFYTMNLYYLIERNFKYVNDGARSISHITNVQFFLINKFKFRKAYCRLNIVYKQKFKILISILFYFRILISFLKFGPFIKLNVLMNQERIRRSYEKRI